MQLHSSSPQTSKRQAKSERPSGHFCVARSTAPRDPRAAERAERDPSDDAELEMSELPCTD